MGWRSMSGNSSERRHKMLRTTTILLDSERETKHGHESNSKNNILVKLRRIHVPGKDTAHERVYPPSLSHARANEGRQTESMISRSYISYRAQSKAIPATDCQDGNDYCARPVQHRLCDNVGECPHS